MAPKNLAKVYSAELVGIDAKLIEVEVDINVGLHSFTIVGLADKAVNEARERVNSALKNSGAKPPNRENRRITVNLAPADVRKAGSQYDLAIAIGYMLATKQIRPFDATDKLFVGELALEGRLRPVSGALSIAEIARGLGFAYLFLPEENVREASLIKDIRIVPIKNLSEAVGYLEGRIAIGPATGSPNASIPKDGEHPHEDSGPDHPDLSLIVGQENAKRALMISAAGSHHLLMVGPPGVGKSMLSHSLAGILPDLTPREAIESIKVWGAAGLGPQKGLYHRPFRAPHHTASHLALTGGGQEPRPGEASLAHGGVLFLDEFPEFPRRALEALREPMESGTIRIARAKQSILFPARFILVAAMNPCPCGYYGDAEHECKCAAYEVIKYQRKISGPLLDRIDIQIKVGRIRIADLAKGESAPTQSPEVRLKIGKARETQAKRFSGLGVIANGEMEPREIQTMALLAPDAKKFLGTLEGSGVSPRAYHRIIKVARTIADLEGVEKISAEHLAEAFSYRIKFA